MSKFFNETQKANQWAEQNPDNTELSIKEMLESLKEGSTPSPEIADVRLSQCRNVHVGNGNNAPLLIRHDDSALAALEAYRGLRTRLMRVQAKSGLRSIAVTSSLPHEGKTLTVLNLGLCYSQIPDQRVLIVDADLRTRGLTRLLGYPSSAGLEEVITGQVTPDEAILATDHKNLFTLPAGADSAPPPELFASPRWQEFLRWCCETFKIVLVDTPPTSPLADFELINAACDGVVLVVRAHSVRRDLLQKTVSALDPEKVVGIVYNAADTGAKNYHEYEYAAR
jgi:protein-tyrosine kinase